MMMFLTLVLGCAQQDHWPTEKLPDACAAGAGPDGEVVMMIKRPHRTRRALLWVPEGPGPHDVVVNLHEFRAEPRRQSYYSGWVELAKQKNAYLVGPDGKSSVWNAGGCCGKAKDLEVDDVGFLDAVVERLDETGCTTGRVLATGIGNGGMMAHHWACNSDVPDGVISVGGALQADVCASTRPIPTLMYHGTEDTWIPADGSGHHIPLSTAETVWAGRNKVTDAKRTVGDGALACTFRDGAAALGVCRVGGMDDKWPGAADAPLTNVQSPLKHAATGGWQWMEQQWAQRPPPAR